MQTAASMPHDGRTPAALQPSFDPTPLDKRTAYFTARASGMSIIQASKAAGVHRDTGARWEAQAKVKQAQLEAQRVVIATKTQLEAKLTEIALHQPDVAPRDQVNAVAQLSRMAGYDAPTRTESVIVHASVQQWIDAQRQAALPAGGAQAQRAIGGEPPIETAAEAVSPPQNISKIPESESK